MAPKQKPTNHPATRPATARPTPSKALGRFVATTRRSRGLSQSGLALASGLGPRHIQGIEQGISKSLDAMTVRALARALEVASDELLDLLPMEVHS